MTVHLDLATHSLPLWFLVVSLFLPRLCMFIAWLQHGMGHYIPVSVSLIGILGWLFIPRLLVLYWIYTDQGIGLWFILHLIALAIAWGGGGNQIANRGRNR